jgi:hypothetical protein
MLGPRHDALLLEAGEDIVEDRGHVRAVAHAGECSTGAMIWILRESMQHW